MTAQPIIELLKQKRNSFIKTTGLQPNILLISGEDLDTLRMSLFGGMLLEAKPGSEKFTLFGMAVLVDPDLGDHTAPKVGLAI